MTGRELIAAAKPLQTFAEQVTHFLRVGHEAVAIEERLSRLTQEVATMSAALVAAQQDLAAMRQARDYLSHEIDTERLAASVAWENEAGERTRALEAQLDAMKKQVAAWRTKQERAEASYFQREGELKAAEAAMVNQVNALRAQAEGLRQAAEAILR